MNHSSIFFDICFGFEQDKPQAPSPAGTSDEEDSGDDGDGGDDTNDVGTGRGLEKHNETTNMIHECPPKNTVANVCQGPKIWDCGSENTMWFTDCWYATSCVPLCFMIHPLVI